MASKLRVKAFAVAVALTFALSGGSALAHNLEVTNPQTGEVVHEQWIGGPTVPANADPMFGPFNLPPSHRTGVVHACQGTAASPAVNIKAPPYYSGCHHGQP
jgi:hypothetical protein